MEIVAATARRERAFPNPINVNARDAGEDEQDENEKETLQSVECKGRRGGVSNATARMAERFSARKPRNRVISPAGTEEFFRPAVRDSGLGALWSQR